MAQRINAVTGTIEPRKTVGALVLADIEPIRRDNTMLIMKDSHTVRNQL